MVAELAEAWGKRPSELLADPQALLFDLLAFQELDMPRWLDTDIHGNPVRRTWRELSQTNEAIRNGANFMQTMQRQLTPQDESEC